MRHIVLALFFGAQSVGLWIPAALVGEGVETWPIDIAPSTREFLMNDTSETSDRKGWVRTAILYRDGQVCLGEWWRPSPDDGQQWRMYLDESEYPTKLVLHADNGTLVKNIDYPPQCGR